MSSLNKNLRRQLEDTVRKARKIGESGAGEALNSLAVAEKEPFSHMDSEQKALRIRLRAHGRGLDDRRDGKSGRQALGHLGHAVAYEHWHRMLFARFLAENDCLLEPESRVAVSLNEVEELARDEKIDVWQMAGRFAERMLPQIFRSDDPSLQISLPLETRVKLERLLAELPTDVFRSDDSLGWVYQFWQADAKDAANKSGNKIGAETLPAVTQLFTEDYMVEFLLHNTLGAWWAGRKLSSENLTSAESEEELRSLCSLSDMEWAYLRFLRDDESQVWRPAAGVYSGWPKTAGELRMLDPSMGSGHFLVFALPILARMRMADENLSPAEAIRAVLHENLFGLELDDRCGQIAAFNLALASWRFAPDLLREEKPLPKLNLAICGQAPMGTREEWLAVLDGRGVQDLRFFMGALYDHFQKAPVLGSLINPVRLLGGLFDSSRLQQLLTAVDTAIEESHPNLGDRYETGVVAQGLAKAVELLAGHYHLVATNVPYLARGKQEEPLREYIERVYPRGKADLATAFVSRSREFLTEGGSAALVTPQNWLFLKSYQKLREELLVNVQWDWVARLGTGAFETISGEVVNVALLSLSRSTPLDSHSLTGLDASSEKTPGAKAKLLQSGELQVVSQAKQLENPDAKIVLTLSTIDSLLENYAEGVHGLGSKDTPRFFYQFWEIPILQNAWEFLHTTTRNTEPYSGMEQAVFWEQGKGCLHERGSRGEAVLAGGMAWGKRGVIVSQMRHLPANLYVGHIFDKNAAVVLPNDSKMVSPCWTYCSCDEFSTEVRKIDQKINVTNRTLVKVPFDLAHWTQVAQERYPHGLPEPYSNDPTQWLFKGRIDDAIDPLQVAVARLLGFRWPAETDPEKAGVEIFESDRRHRESLKSFADEDGVVCLNSLRGETAASDRLHAFLHAAYDTGREHPYQLPANWRDDEIPQAPRPLDFPSAAAWIHHLLDQVEAKDLSNYLRDHFFERHCKLFHHRPFIWHIWDGRPDGFHALVNYHILASPNGEGHKLLENLTYSYLGDWIRRQKDEADHDTPGAEDRLIAAESLQQELKNILTGEPPYDLFIRWKPLHEQSIGWNPDINDGVRLNIRPFLNAKDVRKKGAGILRYKPNVKWGKDRGKEPHRPKEDFPWFWSWDESAQDFQGGDPFDGNRWNDLHYTTEVKQQARKEG